MTNQQEHLQAVLTEFYRAEKAYLEAGGGSFSDIAATLDPECVIHQPASLPYGGEWKGHKGCEAWMKAFAEQWSSMDVKDSELYPSGDVLMSKSHVYAIHRQSGKRLDWPLLQFFRMRDGRILELIPFYWDTATLLQELRDQG